jgi:dipeptidyl aminopeptidase/acylaminoacyl peptidase
MPSQIVVWSASFKVEVLSSRTGRLIRTLAANVALFRGIPTLAVSPAGVVYFSNVRGAGYHAAEWVFSVPLAGGPVTPVAEGSDPALSPDGRLLAYVPWTDPLCPPTCQATPEAIVVRDLPAGTQKTWAFTSTVSFITNLSWSPDGRHLAFAGMTGIKNGTVWVRTAQVLDTRSGGTLADARPIPLGQAAAWAGYLTPQAGAGVLTGPDGMIQVGGGLVEIGISSGRVLRRLTPLPLHGLGTGNVLDGTENTITADRTGRYLLIVGMGTGSGEIFRWTFGMPRPVSIASGALQAVWAG